MSEERLYRGKLYQFKKLWSYKLDFFITISFLLQFETASVDNSGTVFCKYNVIRILIGSYL